MEHSSDETVITVQFRDETEHHLPGPRAGEFAFEQVFPQYSNREESSALVSEIRRSAEQLGAQLEPRRERREERPGTRHFDGGIDWTVIVEFLLHFARARGGAIGGGAVGGGAVWLFLRQCRPLIIQWMANKASRSITVEYATDKEGTVTKKMYISGDNDIDEAIEALKQFEGEEQENRNTET